MYLGAGLKEDRENNDARGAKAKIHTRGTNRPVDATAISTSGMTRNNVRR